MPSRAVLFFDTSALLHFQFPADIDWCAALQVDRVLIVIPSVVAWELNDKKDSGTKLLKSRAAKVVKRLAEVAEQTPTSSSPWSNVAGLDQSLLFTLRKGVEIYFDTRDPELDPQDHLSSASRDDRLIASVLQFFRTNPTVRVEVRARDFGLALKMKKYPVPLKEPPEGTLLPDEPDPDRQRIRELEKEVAELKSAEPRLVLAFRGKKGRPVHQGEATLRIPRPPTTEEVETIINAARKRHYPLEKAEVQVRLVMAALPEKDHDKRIDAYNASLATYFEELRKFLETYREANPRVRCFPIRLLVSNVGQEPAKNVRLTVRFPDTMSVHLKSPEAPPIPQPPKKPTVSTWMGQHLVAFMQMQGYPSGPRWDTFESLQFSDPLPSFNRPEVRGNTVTFEDRRLEHSHGRECRPIFVVFNSLADIKPFQIEYSFYADNLRRMGEGESTVIVKREDLNVPNLPSAVEEPEKPSKNT